MPFTKINTLLYLLYLSFPLFPSVHVLFCSILLFYSTLFCHIIGVFGCCYNCCWTLWEKVTDIMILYPWVLYTYLLRTRIFFYITIIQWSNSGNLTLNQYYYLIHSKFLNNNFFPTQDLIKDPGWHIAFSFHEWKWDSTDSFSLKNSLASLCFSWHWHFKKYIGQLFCRIFLNLGLSDCFLMSEFTFGRSTSDFLNSDVGRASQRNEAL